MVAATGMGPSFGLAMAEGGGGGSFFEPILCTGTEGDDGDGTSLDPLEFTTDRRGGEGEEGCGEDEDKDKDKDEDEGWVKWLGEEGERVKLATGGGSGFDNKMVGRETPNGRGFGREAPRKRFCGCAGGL